MFFTIHFGGWLRDLRRTDSIEVINSTILYIPLNSKFLLNLHNFSAFFDDVAEFFCPSDQFVCVHQNSIYLGGSWKSNQPVN